MAHSDTDKGKTMKSAYIPADRIDDDCPARTLRGVVPFPHLPASNHTGPGPNVCAFCLRPIGSPEQYVQTDLDAYQF